MSNCATSVTRSSAASRSWLTPVDEWSVSSVATVPARARGRPSPPRRRRTEQGATRSGVVAPDHLVSLWTPSMFEDRIAALESEFDAVEVDLANPDILSDSDRVRDLSRRHKELGEIVRVWHELIASRADVATAREMLTEASGDELEMMRQEVEEAEAAVAEHEARIQ